MTYSTTTIPFFVVNEYIFQNSMSYTYTTFDCTSLFGINTLRPAEYNSLIVVLCTALVVWVAHILKKILTTRRIINILESHGICHYIPHILPCPQNCLHLRGLGAYANDFKHLLGIHVTQVLRLKRTIPSIIVPRIIIPASIDQDSLKLIYKKRHNISASNDTYIPPDSLLRHDLNVPDTSIDGYLEFAYCSNTNTIATIQLLHGYTREVILRYDSSLPLKPLLSSIPYNITTSTTSYDDDTTHYNKTTFLPLPNLFQLNDDVSHIQNSLDTTVSSNTISTVPIILPSTEHHPIIHHIKIPENILSRFNVLKDDDNPLSPMILLLLVQPNHSHLYTDSNKQTNESNNSDMINPFFGGIPIAESYSQIMECSVYYDTTPMLHDRRLTVSKQIFFSSIMMPSMTSLIPSRYYATFQEFFNLSQQPCISENNESNRRLHRSELSHEYLEQEERNPNFLTNPTVTHPFEILQSTIQSIINLSFLQRLYVHMNSHTETTSQTIPTIVPPTPQQFSEIIGMQEDVEIFGYTNDDEKDCVICMAAPKEVTLLPCRHSSCCSKCLHSLRQGKCPICRRVFSSYVILTFRNHNRTSSSISNTSQRLSF